MRTLITILILTVGVISCGTKRQYNQKVEAMISKINKPFLISNFTPHNLIDKSGVNEDGVLPYTYQTLTSFFLKEEGTGVDFDERVQMVMAKGPMMPNMYAFFKIKDNSLFKTMLKAELNADIKEKDEIEYFVKKKEGYVVAWQNENAIVANITFDLKSMFSGKADNGGKTLNRLIKLFEYSNDGEINKDFETILNKSDDINYYVDIENLINYIEEMNPLASGEKNEKFEQFKDVTLQFAVNFEKGKVTLTADMDLSEDLFSKLNVLYDKGLSNQFLNFGKTDIPMFTYALNVDIENYFNLIEEFWQEEMIDNFDEQLSEFGLTKDDIVKSFTGEILVMADGYITKSQMIDYGYGEPFEETNSEPLIGIVLGVKDLSVFTGLFDSSEELANNVNKINEMYFVIMNNMAFVSNDSLWAYNVATKQTTKITATKYVETKPISMYVNFSNQAINNYLKSKGNNPLNVIEYIEMFGQITKGELEMSLTNKNENALKVLIRYYSDLMADIEAQQNQDMQNILDQEILNNLEENLSEIDSSLNKIGTEIENTLNSIDVDEVIDDASKELNSILNQIEK